MSKSTAPVAATPATLPTNLGKLSAAQVATLFGMATNHGMFKDAATPTTGAALAKLLNTVALQQQFIKVIKNAQGSAQHAALAALFGRGTTAAPKATAGAGGQGRKFPNEWVLLSINCASNPKSGASATRFALYSKLGVGTTLGALKEAGMKAADFGWDTHPTRGFVTLGPASELKAAPKAGTKRASNGVTVAASAAPAPKAEQPVPEQPQA